MVNLYKFGYMPWKPSNWFENFRQFFRNLKYARQRIERGWADCDTWDMCGNELSRMADMIDFLARNHHGYPSRYCHLNDDEKASKMWKEDLVELSISLLNLQKVYNAETYMADEEMKELSAIVFLKLSEFFPALWD